MGLQLIWLYGLVFEHILYIVFVVPIHVNSAWVITVVRFCKKDLLILIEWNKYVIYVT